METETERSELTLPAIVDAALRWAMVDGLEGLSLGELGKHLQPSKSGVFSLACSPRLQPRNGSWTRPSAP